LVFKNKDISQKMIKNIKKRSEALNAVEKYKIPKKEKPIKKKENISKTKNAFLKNLANLKRGNLSHFKAWKIGVSFKLKFISLGIPR